MMHGSTDSRVKEFSASEIRRRARGILDDGRGLRLTLALAVVVVTTAAVGAFLLGEAVYAVGDLIFGDSLWVDVAAHGVMLLLGLFGVLPLTMGTYRLACLAYPPKHREVELPVVEAQPELAEMLQPFTSWRAYLRSLAVGLELAGWVTLIAVIPLVGETKRTSSSAYTDSSPSEQKNSLHKRAIASSNAAALPPQTIR